MKEDGAFCFRLMCMHVKQVIRLWIEHTDRREICS